MLTVLQTCISTITSGTKHLRHFWHGSEGTVLTAVFVCLSVCEETNSNSYEWIFMKFKELVIMDRES